MKRILIATATTILVAGLALPICLRATAIVAFRTPARIVFAADSALTSIRRDGTPGVIVTTGNCKIKKAGRWWVLLGGLSSTAPGRLDRRPPLDVYETVVRAVAPSSTVSGALASVERAYMETDGIRDRLAAFTAHPQFSELLAPGQSVLAVVVAGIDRGVLTLGCLATFHRAEKPVEWGGVCPGQCQNGRVFLAASVTDKPMQALVRTLPHPAWLELADPVAARRLIEMQIDATPEKVKRPVDVLEITTAGARWVLRDRASACAAIQ